jgi:hypothetical protein
VPKRGKIDIEKIRASLFTLCHNCGHTITPERFSVSIPNGCVVRLAVQSSFRAALTQVTKRSFRGDFECNRDVSAPG